MLMIVIKTRRILLSEGFVANTHLRRYLVNELLDIHLLWICEPAGVKINIENWKNITIDSTLSETNLLRQQQIKKLPDTSIYDRENSYDDNEDNVDDDDNDDDKEEDDLTQQLAGCIEAHQQHHFGQLVAWKKKKIKHGFCYGNTLKWWWWWWWSYWWFCQS